MDAETAEQAPDAPIVALEERPEVERRRDVLGLGFRSCRFETAAGGGSASAPQRAIPRHVSGRHADHPRCERARASEVHPKLQRAVSEDAGGAK